jgi:hypothetical protein
MGVTLGIILRDFSVVILRDRIGQRMPANGTSSMSGPTGLLRGRIRWNVINSPCCRTRLRWCPVKEIRELL